MPYQRNHEVTFIEALHDDCGTKGLRSDDVVVVRGKPGAGKTYLSNFFHTRSTQPKPSQINADLVRRTLNAHLGFTEEDRVHQARTLGYLARFEVLNGRRALVDFVMPTKATYDAFVDALRMPFVLIDLLTSEDRYADTSKLYQTNAAEWGHPPDCFLPCVSKETDIVKIYDWVFPEF